MNRTNPRSVILAALQEGPLPLIDNHEPRPSLAAAVWRACYCERPTRAWRELKRGFTAGLQRHLCKLIRSRKVVRLGDGRYALRKGPYYWPGKAMYGGKITIYLNGEDVGTVQIKPGDAASDVQAKVDAYMHGAVGSLAFIQAYPEGKE